jgi:hypothetical protein
MPKSIVLFERLAYLAVALRLVVDGASWLLDYHAARHQTGFLLGYDACMVGLRIAVIWLIVHRRSNLMRWGWIGLAIGSAGFGTAGFVTQPGGQAAAVWPLIFTVYFLTLAAGFFLLAPASWRWFRGGGQALPG